MKSKSLALIISLIPVLAAAQDYSYIDGKTSRAVPQGQQHPSQLAEQQAAGSLETKNLQNNPANMAKPMPDATMLSPVPPVSNAFDPQMAASYPGQSAVPQPAVGMSPPTIRAEMSRPAQLKPAAASEGNTPYNNQIHNINTYWESKQ